MTKTIDNDQRERLIRAMAPIEFASLAPLADRDGLSVKSVDVKTGPSGEFTARVSDFQKDRDNEQFGVGAFDDVIRSIRSRGRGTPVLFGHDISSLDAVLGVVGPNGWQADRTQLLAKGWIDTENAVGRKVHGMLAKGALAWSIRFRADPSSRRKEADGSTTIGRVTDLAELSAVPVPSNDRTSTLSIKSDEPHEPRSHVELYDMLVRAGIIARPAQLEAVYERARQDMFSALTGEGRNGSCPIHGPKQASAPGKAAGPAVTIATFTTS